jgi:hypothetical protein
MTAESTFPFSPFFLSLSFVGLTVPGGSWRYGLLMVSAAVADLL